LDFFLEPEHQEKQQPPSGASWTLADFFFGGYCLLSMKFSCSCCNMFMYSFFLSDKSALGLLLGFGVVAESFPKHILLYNNIL